MQAILPLRGKILNVERKDDAALYKSQEISSLIVALGLGTKGNGSSSSSKGKKGRSRRSSTVADSSAEEQGDVTVTVDADSSGSTDPLKNLRSVYWFRPG